MKRPPHALLPGWILLAAVACGRKGPLELPYSRIPAPVEDVVVYQRGDRAVLEWTNPEKNIDGHPPVNVEAVEIWLASGGPALTSGDLEKFGRMIVRLTEDDLASFNPDRRGGIPPRLTTSVPLDGSPPTARAFSLRVQANGKRLSDFSPPVSLEIRPCALPPEAPAAAVSEMFVELRWSPPGANVDGTTPPVIHGYTVYRSEDGRPPRRLNSEPLTDLRYEDRDVTFGSLLRYHVRTASSAEFPYLESADSEAVEIRPRDTFPPSPPEGLVGIVEGGAVSLSWKAGREEDLVGYRVWRREEGTGTAVLLTRQPIKESVFRDSPGPGGRVYLYSVSALDGHGNESERSRPVTARLKEGGG